MSQQPEKEERTEDVREETSDKSGAESDESSSTEEEVVVSEAVDNDYLLLLSYLKSKDSTMYDENHKFFNENDFITRKKSQKKTQFLKKDYERQMILEKNGNFESDDEAVASGEINGDEDNGCGRAFQRTTNAENSKLIEAIKQKADLDSDNEELFTFKKVHEAKKRNTKDEKDYARYLKGEQDKLPDCELEKKIKPLKDFWSDPKLDPKENFLMDYILSMKSHDLESEDDENGDADADASETQKLEEFDQVEETFEKFESDSNLRHDTATVVYSNCDFIKKYSKSVESSIRKRDDKRSQKREKKKERKKKEKIRKIQQLKRNENLQRKTVAQKLEQLRKITGNPEIDLTIEDFEDDFDPEKHDQKMAAIFNDKYYENVDQNEEKPELLSDDDCEDGVRDRAVSTTHGEEKNSNEFPHCEDPDFNMDCDYNEQSEKANKGLSKKDKNKQRKNKSDQKQIEGTSETNDQDKSLQILEISRDLKKSIRELANAGCEDFIGDMPCRYKYTSVLPNDYGLTTEEILMADDKELDRWYSCREMMKIRSDQEERRLYAMYQKKGRNEKLKRKLLPSLYKHELKNDEDVEETEEETKKGTKSTKSAQKSTNIKNAVGKKRKRSQNESNSSEATETAKKKPRSKFNSEKELGMKISDSRLEAFGLNPNKFRRQKKYENRIRQKK